MSRRVVVLVDGVRVPLTADTVAALRVVLDNLGERSKRDAAADLERGVRDYLGEHPDASANEVVAALRQRRRDVLRAVLAARGAREPVSGVPSPSARFPTPRNHFHEGRG